MIPANVDLVGIFDELNARGINDYKIEAMCGLAEGYVSHIRAGRRQQMSYQRTARVYNLWCEETLGRAPEPVNCQAEALTT